MMDFESDPQQPATSTRIDRIAADWLARSIRGLSATERAEFRRWRKSNERHAAIFDDLERTWRSLDALDKVRLPNGCSLFHDLPARIVPARVVPSFSPRPVIWIAATMAAAAALMLTTRWAPENEPSSSVIRSASTETGGFEKLSLPDGSVIRLNTDSAIDVAFSKGQRRVTLARGEASFDVAADQERPFIVQAGAVAVRAVGTSFNVRYRAEIVDVLITEGMVRVDDVLNGASLLPGGAQIRDRQPESLNDDSAVLTAGQRATIQHRATAKPSLAVVAAVDRAEITRELAWQERRLEFFDTPLSKVVAEFNRYNRHKLVIADPRLNDRRFGASIRADNSDAFVRLLEARFGVKAEEQAGQTVLRHLD